MFVCRECRGFDEWVEMMVREGLCVCVCVLSMYGVCAVCVSLSVCVRAVVKMFLFIRSSKASRPQGITQQVDSSLTGRRKVYA